MANSEVSRLLSQIELEYEAAQQGLHGIAVTASHQFITARMERIAECYALLVKQVGEQTAANLVVQQEMHRADP